MNTKEKVKFTTSFLKEVKKLDIYKKYPNILDWLSSYLINPKTWNLRAALEQAADFFDEMEEVVSSFISEEEVIYYEKAMQILEDLDSSLIYPLNIAYNLGYDIKDLNSELLATLAIQDKLREELLPLIEELTEEASY